MPPEALADAQDPAAYGALFDCLRCGFAAFGLLAAVRLIGLVARRR